MATTIKLKNSVTTTNAPSSLVQGEVAINITDKKVWVGNAATTPVQLLGDGGSANFTSIAFGAGTVSLPSITFTGDTNTGIYSPAADTIAFTEGGVESMRITSAGDVGIGTSSPAAKLHVNGENIIVDRNASDPYYTFYTGGVASNVSIYGGSSNGFRVFTNSAERMRIDSSGNVLVNTTATIGTSKFVVAGVNGSTSPKFQGASNSGAYLDFYNNAQSTDGFRIGQGFSSGSDNIALISNNDNAAMVFRTNATERMRITSGGLVGIGKTPTDKELEIYGATNPALRIQNSTTGTSASDGLLLEANGSNINFYNYEAGNIQFGTSGSERMRITSSGDLLVGTTTKSNDEKVTIYQSANAVGLSIRSNSGPVSGNYESSDDGHNAYWTFGRDNQTTGNFVFYNTGNLRGSINNATGAYTATSDARVKKNIETLQYGLQEVLSLRPVLYLMEQESDDSKKHIGFIAQEVKAVMDEAVDDLQDERTQLYGLDKSGLVPVLVKAIQEQQAMIEELTNRIKKLEGV